MGPFPARTEAFLQQFLQLCPCLGRGGHICRATRAHGTGLLPLSWAGH